MPYEADPNLDLSRAKEVSLGGKTFYVMPVPLRHVIAMSSVIPKMIGVSPEDIVGDTHLNLMVDVLMKGLARGHPNLTKDELLELPVTLEELTGAFPVVVMQAGGGPKRAGEEAAARPALEGGTASSLN